MNTNGHEGQRATIRTRDGEIYIVQRGHKYLTNHGGWTPRLSAAHPSSSREQAARHQQLHRANGTINLVHPQKCAGCGELFDPIMRHECSEKE